MTESDARLALLQAELSGIQAGIRSLDTTVFQIKGWCVTVALAIGGFAIAYRKPALLLVGIGAVISFFLIDCQYKLIQRAFINRNNQLDAELKATGIMEVLKGNGTIDIVGTANLEWPYAHDPYYRRVTQYLASLWPEARSPSTAGLYVFIMICLVVELLILA